MPKGHMNRLKKGAVCLHLVASLFCISCSLRSAGGRSNQELTQLSTLGALSSGLFDGLAQVQTMSRYGNLGLGTFDHLDGEMIQVDGVVYQVIFNGTARKASPKMKSPFFMTTFFKPGDSFNVPPGIQLSELEKIIDGRLSSKNFFYAVRIDGTFRQVKVRSVPPQSKPYPPLAEVVVHQAVFELGNVRGTAVGFRCPTYASTINASGYHFHFINEKRTAGGHVMDLVTKDVTIRLDIKQQFTVLLPEGNADWNTADLR